MPFPDGHARATHDVGRYCYTGEIFGEKNRIFCRNFIILVLDNSIVVGRLIQRILPVARGVALNFT